VAVKLLAAIRDTHGSERLWNMPGARPEWFDKLMGTDRVRRQLQAGTGADEIIAGWQAELQAFHKTRQPALLY
jgi:uncharacterized protein YbbC (DUF1343 family)